MDAVPTEMMELLSDAAAAFFMAQSPAAPQLPSNTREEAEVVQPLSDAGDGTAARRRIQPTNADDVRWGRLGIAPKAWTTALGYNPADLVVDVVLRLASGQYVRWAGAAAKVTTRRTTLPQDIARAVYAAHSVVATVDRVVFTAAEAGSPGPGPKFTPSAPGRGVLLLEVEKGEPAGDDGQGAQDHGEERRTRGKAPRGETSCDDGAPSGAAAAKRSARGEPPTKTLPQGATGNGIAAAEQAAQPVERSAPTHALPATRATPTGGGNTHQWGVPQALQVALDIRMDRMDARERVGMEDWLRAAMAGATDGTEREAVVTTALGAMAALCNIKT